uniref:Polyprotein P1234 n=2 Tax=Southern elephant seal virus TaxID=1159195 RepID=H6SU02_9VIRU|nr:non structural polyprotein ns123 [Southern elephant seal virus]AEJ36232.1 non structural polyprotein [Southern elephant seal virus]
MDGTLDCTTQFRMDGKTVFLDVDPEGPFMKHVERCFPSITVEARQVTPNDHANARAFSHLASKMIENEVQSDQVILDIGSAPSRRMFSAHHYHCICPMKAAEDPERMMRYAERLKAECERVTDKNLADKMADLQRVMQVPSEETESICLKTDATCEMRAQVAVYQDVYAVHGPSSIYAQALKGVRTVYWIGFDTTPFAYDALAGSYPLYNTNWADEAVLQSRNIGLCSSNLAEEKIGGWSLFRKKKLKATNSILFSVGSTLYKEDRNLLKSWHLPAVFHLKGKECFTCRCETLVSCEGYVLRKISISQGLYGEPCQYAVTHHHEGFLVAKVTDTIDGVRVSFPVTTYVPAIICDQMTGILATEVSPEDAQKLLVGLNQRIVVNGRTQRNTNSVKNFLLPLIAQAMSKWAQEYKTDVDGEKKLGARTRTVKCCCVWAFKKQKQHTMYKKPDTQSIIKVPGEYSAFMPTPWSAGLPYTLRKKILLLLRTTQEAHVLITNEDVERAKVAQTEAEEARLAEEQHAALPPLEPSAPELEDEIEVEELLERAGAGVVETPRNAIRVVAHETDTMMGKYLVATPQLVLRSAKLECIHSLAEEVKVMTHSGRSGRYPVEAYDGRVLLPTGAALTVKHFQALAESATMVYNEREFINRKLYYIAIHGAALNTDDEQYKCTKASEASGEFVFDVDKRRCVPLADASGLVLVGELTNPPYHEMAYESLKTRPAHTHDVEIVGVYGVPGSGKSGIIKQLVTPNDLVSSGKKENCTEIMKDVKKARGLDIVARTVDSVLLNGVRRKIDTLYVDEAFACHAGTLLALISIVRPRRRVVLCGDPKQCGFFNVMQMKVHYNYELCDTVHHKSISRRCTQAVTAIVSTLHYDGKMKTVNTVYGKPVVDTTGCTKPRPGDLILTCFRGWVKQLQLDYRGHEVMTAAASQGLTRHGVYAVRLKVNENPLYANKSEHVNVLLTRTDERIIWKTLSGDPWIKLLTEIPTGNFSATMQEWQNEHDTILNALHQPPGDRDVFAGKTKVCWAKALAPVLRTAGVILSAEEWSHLIPAFRNDEAFSPEVALNMICSRLFGHDLDSGLFSEEVVSMTYRNNHWDNSAGGKMWGFNEQVFNTLARRFPIMHQARATRQCPLLMYGTLADITSARVVPPVNRCLPHPLTTPAKTPRDDTNQFWRKLPGSNILYVGCNPPDFGNKRREWLGHLDCGAAQVKTDLGLGIPAAMGRYDGIFVDVKSTADDHYTRCEEHAIKMRMIAGDALFHLKPGAWMLLTTYGYADRISESVLTAIVCKFRSYKVLPKQFASDTAEVTLLLQAFDNGRRQTNLGKLSAAISGLLHGLQPAGTAPNYRVVRADIAKTTTEAVVNAANPLGVPGAGVCGAIARQWPKGFPAGKMQVGECKAVVTDDITILHTVGPDFRKTGEKEGDELLAMAYQNCAAEASSLGFHTLAIPLLSTGIYSAGVDRLDQSLKHLLNAFDETNIEVHIYCRDKTWESRILRVISTRDTVEELVEENVELSDEIVRVHPASSLEGREGYSSTTGSIYSFLPGTKFHQTAVDVAEIKALWPKEPEANEQICNYILGDSMNQIRDKCPVEDIGTTSPPCTVPCLCPYAMTAERVYRVRATAPKSFIVCSSFQLPKYRITGVQRVPCTRPFKQVRSSGASKEVAEEVSLRPASSFSGRYGERLTVKADVYSLIDSRWDSIDSVKLPSLDTDSTTLSETPPPRYDTPAVATTPPVPPPRLKKLARQQALSQISFGDFEPGEPDRLAAESRASREAPSITFGDFQENEVDSIVSAPPITKSQRRRRRRKARRSASRQPLLDSPPL